MRVLKEGLHTYMVAPYYENTYYESIEYPMIKYNAPSTILPVQIRKTDGAQEIYYEITGKISLEEWGEKKQIRYEDIYQFLKNMYDMFSELEEYMLSIHQIVLDRESVFVGANNQIRWMYGPDKNEEIHKKFEELFLWLLSTADFEDMRGANLIHKSYIEAKNVGISKEYLEKCLELQKADPYESQAGFSENTFQEEKKSVDFEGKMETKNEESVDREFSAPKKCGKRGFFSKLLCVLKILLIILDLALLAYWGYGFYLYGLQKKGLVFCGILVIVFLFFTASLIYDWRHCDLEEEEKTENPSVVTGGQPEYSSVTTEMEEKSFHTGRNNESFAFSEDSIFEKLEKHWGVGGETVLLSDAIPQYVPVLYSEKTHQVVKIQVFPFYIGSEEGLNQLPIPNRTVSRQHAVIVKKEEEYYLEDLESKNGTKIDGKRLLPEVPEVIAEGSRMEFSNEAWIFHYDMSLC